MLDELERDDVGGGALRDHRHVAGREHRFVRHQGHGGAAAQPRHARDIPRGERLLYQGDAELGQDRQTAHRRRLVPGLIGVDDQLCPPLQGRGEPAEAREILLGRLRADLDFEHIVEPRR